MVPLAGVEPARPYEHDFLRVACLPVPSQRRSGTVPPVQDGRAPYYVVDGATCQDRTDDFLLTRQALLPTELRWRGAGGRNRTRVS